MVTMSDATAAFITTITLTWCAGSPNQERWGWIAERLSGTRYDAVIADVCLTPQHGSEGLAIAAYLRHLKTDPPVVVLTAYGLPDRAEAAARLGVDAFLHKPVSLVWLETLLRGRIDDRRGPQAQPMAAAG